MSTRKNNNLKQTWVDDDLHKAWEAYIKSRGTNSSIELRNAMRGLLKLEGKLKSVSTFDPINAI